MSDHRHGDWLMFVPEDDSEQWELYEGVSAPVEYCGCEQSGCDMCEDDDGRLLDERG